MAVKLKTREDMWLEDLETLERALQVGTETADSVSRSAPHEGALDDPPSPSHPDGTVQCQFGEEMEHLDAPTPSTSKEDAAAQLQNISALVCSVCARRFKYPSWCERHELTHTDIRMYKCQLCGETYKDKASLKRHLNRTRAHDSLR